MCFSLRRNGEFRGHCHIEFVTKEVEEKAVELNGEYLLGRPVELGFPRESYLSEFLILLEE
ncbi:hypothetical protein MKW98_025087 [Papaver atlanticum]|uniref:RRM domain-containing protein n=1 Tax=Papaver atlanticum TaxID=357466 RepID=A0AAD4X7G8_9MAGN|nr:hypothetical protein MKW98_025087 [Papaver atlanticum]